MPWIGLFFENAFGSFYSPKGPPAKPIGLMVGGCMLKRLYHLGGQTLMERWIEHPTLPYFTGVDVMKHQPPGDSSDGRKRDGRHHCLWGLVASERNQKIIDGLIRYHRTREQREVSDRCPTESKSHRPMPLDGQKK